MTPARSFWPGLIAAGVTYQVLALRRHDDSHLSACIRVLYRTHTRGGRVALVVTYVAAGVVLLPHWCKAAASTVQLVTAIEEATP